MKDNNWIYLWKKFTRDMSPTNFVKQIFIFALFLLPFSFVCAQENENLFESYEDSLMDETLLPQVIVTDSVKSAKMIIMKMIENNKKNIGRIKSYQASEVRRYSQNINEVPKKWKRIAKIALLFSRYRKLVNLSSIIQHFLPKCHKI